jgi:hypothetical protein
MPYGSLFQYNSSFFSNTTHEVLIELFLIQGDAMHIIEYLCFTSMANLIHSAKAYSGYLVCNGYVWCLYSRELELVFGVRKKQHFFVIILHSLAIPKLELGTQSIAWQVNTG